MIIEELTDLQLLESALVHYKNTRARSAYEVVRCDMLIDQLSDEVVDTVSADY